MFKKKKKNEIKKVNFRFGKIKEKKLDTSVHIGEEGDYAVLEPLDILKQKADVAKDNIKPKLIIRKPEPKEVEPKTPTQQVHLEPSEQPIKPEESISKIPINHIETDIDKLMKLIDEKKIIGLEELSKILKINPDRLEIWAKILEENGLIEIEYPIIGLPKLRKKEWQKKS